MKRLSNSPCALLVSLVFLLANSFAYATDQDGDGVADSTVTQLSAGAIHGCILDADGVRCFGDNYYGAVTVPPLSNPTAIAAGLPLSCAIDDSGVKCWAASSIFTTIPPLTNPFAVIAGGNFACALDQSASGVKCWGNPIVVNNTPTLTNPTVLTAGYEHACAIDNTGVHCWGKNDGLQLNVPNDLVAPTAVAAGIRHTCVIDSGNVRCWGANNYGQLNVPTLVNPVSIVAAGDDTCAFDDSGAHCWGGNILKPSPYWTSISLTGDAICGMNSTGVQCKTGYSLKIGDNCPAVSNADQLDSDNDYLGDVCDDDNDNDTLLDSQELACGSNPFSAGSVCPVSNSVDTDGDGIYDSTTHPIQISTGAYHSCALDITGVSCWGANVDTQTTAPILATPLMVSAGGYHSCAIDLTGLKCWGQDNFSQSSDVPVLTNPLAVSAGLYHTCALDGSSVKCWGVSGFAEEEVNFGQTIVPVDLGSAVAVSAGGYHTCAITSAGAVRCWGDNGTNQLSVPTLINPTAISAGYAHTCALDNTGVKCWGNNDALQINVPDLTNPTAVSAGLYHTCALDSSGVKCWGDNGAGQSTVPTLINPVAISAGGAHSCAIDATGVKCWGSDGYKQATVPTHRLFNYIGDADDDNDGVRDTSDAFPLNSAESADNDGDSVGDNGDLDDDNDGVLDASDSQPLLQNSKSKLISVATKDGWLLESTETSKKGGKADSGSSTLIVGDSVKNQEYRSILHFDTASLPNNAVITKVTLTLKKQSLKGDVKPLGNLVVDMKQKNFGSSTSLAVNDFEATAGKLSVGTFKASGSTYTATLNSTGRGYISKTAATQFKIHFTKDDNNDKGDDYLKFYSGSASTSSRPSLVIEYYVP